MSAIADLTVASDPHVFLIGRPPIGELLGFFRTSASMARALIWRP